MSRRKHRLTFTRQYDAMDCGPACVRMVASAHGKVFPLAWLRNVACLTREGVSVAGIRRALGRVRMESGAFRMTLDDLAAECPLPAILHWNQNHFVVLEGVSTRRGVRQWSIADPAFGRHTATDADMAARWLAGDKGVVVAAEPGEGFGEQTPESERHSFMAFAREHVWPYRASMVKSALVMLAGLLLSLTLPYLTQAMVDRGIGARDTGFIFAVLAAQLAIVAGSFVIQLIGNKVTLYMSTHISISIITAYLTKLMRLPMAFFDTKSAGDYQQRIADHTRLQSFLTVGSLQTLFSLVSVPFYLIVIGTYNLVVLAAYVVFTALSISWSVWFFKRRRALDYEQFQLSALARNRMYEITGGIVDIKVNGFEQYKIDQWRDLQQKQYDMSLRVMRLDQQQNAGFLAIGETRNLFIMCWIALLVVDGSMTLGMMMSVSVIIGMVSGPLGQLVDFMRRMQDARISLERSDEVRMASDEDNPGLAAVHPSRPMDLELRGVTFAYGGAAGKPAVSDVSFTIPAGAFVAVVGESGSGKTTLMKLLLKFYEPQQGDILLGGRPIGSYSAASLRSACGIVSQDNFLFSDTLERNIVLGCDYDRERLDRAVATACLGPVVSSRPLGLHTRVGAEGEGLSGGERQRVMMARVAYKQPPYIMLDEATSNLDARTEQQITDNVERRFAGSTRLVIAHRLSTVRRADLIVVMRAGRVVETGTHAELVERRGYYYELIRNQLDLPTG